MVELADGESILRYLEAILDLADEGIHVVDPMGKTIFYNRAMGRIEGLRPEAVVGKTIPELFPSLSPETSTLLRVLRTGVPICDQLQAYVNYKGAEIVTVNTTVPVRHGGVCLGAIEVARDVTRVKELAEKVVELRQQLSVAAPRPRDSTLGARYTLADIVGADPVLRRAVEHARKASRTSSPVLLCGETGTGKEMFAQGIHQAGARAGGPFIAQNCAALPGGLLEGILFGTVKGGFTGAVDRPGLFEQASGGTLLLDEVNLMGPDLQAKLLRVLEEGSVRRVGSARQVPIDVRVVATTSVEPREALEAGMLRKDLYFRLSVVVIRLPPLRERPGDIPLLVEHFLGKYNRLLRRNVRGVSPAVEEGFLAHRWPGNVRELEHVIEGAMNAMDEGETCIEPVHLPPAFRAALESPSIQGEAPTLSSTLEAIERRMISSALAETGGNISRAARGLGVKRQSLQQKMRKYGIARERREAR